MKTTFYVLFLIATCTTGVHTLYAQINAQDSLALVDLYNSTDGQHWNNNTGWLTQQHVEDWFGVSTKNHRVKSIGLPDNNLRGVLPASLGNLNELKQLYLIANKLRGNIPSTLGNLVNVVDFDLSINQLTGTIPHELGNLVNANFFILYNNRLSGTIPASLSNLKNLVMLDLNFNRLRGEIPSFKNAIFLNTALFDHNNLSGKIPSSFKNLQYLTALTVDHNQYTFDGLERAAAELGDIITYGHQKFIFVHKRNHLLSVNAGGTLSNNTYKWFRNGVLDTTITGNSTYLPKANGIYSVNINNAVATEVTLHAYTIVFAASSDLNQSQIDSPLINNIELSVFPNPANNIIHINGLNFSSALITIQDELGNTLIKGTITGKNQTINISSIKPGMYNLTVSQNGKSMNAKFIKQ
jgi:hypothetical protein